jgi:leader peptidase (prepilin peptidase)/N-methyltransferase
MSPPPLLLPGLLPALAAAAGLILGSFIAALSWRWPRGLSIARGRSHCDSCHAPLAALDLIPLLSHLRLRGRCRSCHAPIPPRHLLIELAAATLTTTAALIAPNLQGLALAAFGLALLTLAVLDLEHFWLPDRLTLPLLATGLLLGHFLPPPFPAPLPDRLIGAALGYASLALIALAYKKARGHAGLGGGDPKLFAAIGAWLGWTALPLVLLGASLLGLLAVLAARLRGQRLAADTPLPFGALLAAAAWPLALLPFAH